MTSIAHVVDSFRDEKCLADHEVSIQVIENVWMLATGYSILHYVAAATLARNNADAIVAFTCALAASDNSAKTRDIRAGSSGATSVEDRLASAQRSIEGKTYVDAQVGMMMPFRKDLFLVSGVIC